MTSAGPTVATEFVVGLHDRAGSSAEESGTKAATLARLAAQGFQVPDGGSD